MKNTDHAEPLKPCPFCGASVACISFGDVDGRFGPAEGYWLIMCDGDEGCEVEPEIEGPDKAAIIAAWNRRAPVGACHLLTEPMASDGPR